jgi:hypothetical protein
MDGQQLQKYEPPKDSATLPRDRSPAAMALDSLIRRKLRVSDPSDATQVAMALGQLYRSDREAMEREAAGLPFLTGPIVPAMVRPPTSSSAELDQATGDVERDLGSLTSNALLKDIVPELNGWATTIRQAIADGIAAARFALDPHQRDKAFAARRLLGDFARIARFVGAMTATVSPAYRKLAQSLDEVAGLLLVLMGDALANIGFGSGRFLLQAPVSELQTRRDTVVYALRNLVGSAQEAYQPDVWPRGLVAYRQFLRNLEANGQADLRGLFQENNIARLMDDLIQLATNGTADGLRALGSTARMALQSFKRLIVFGKHLVDPESPPLTAYLSALHLFVDAFEHSNSGYRLLAISRPPIVFYGLYGVGGPDQATQRLQKLITLRGSLAEELDCYLGCECGEVRVTCQIIFDKVLYDVDRAIDLYALGVDEFGEPEQRAAAYGYVINAVLTSSCGTPPNADLELVDVLAMLRDTLWSHRFAPADFSDVPDGVIVGTSPLSTTGATLFTGSPPAIVFSPIKDLRKQVFKLTSTPDSGNPDAGVYHFLEEILDPNDEVDGIPEDRVPNSLKRIEHMLEIMIQELCVQELAERTWLNMLQTMAPSCIRLGGDGPVIALLNRAKLLIDGSAPCPALEVKIPPHRDTNLAGVSYFRSSQGAQP